MKKALILLTSTVAMMAIAALPGCSGGGDDDDDDDGGSGLASGTYAVSGASITDTCFGSADSYYAGATEVSVTVSGISVAISGFADDIGYDISGTSLVDNVFGTPSTSPIDFTDNTSADYPLTPNTGNEYACKLDLFIEYAGTITGANEFTLNDTVSMTVTSGAGCSAAVVSSAFTGTVLAIPCETNDSVDLAL